MDAPDRFREHFSLAARRPPLTPAACRVLQVTARAWGVGALAPQPRARLQALAGMSDTRRLHSCLALHP